MSTVTLVHKVPLHTLHTAKQFTLTYLFVKLVRYNSYYILDLCTEIAAAMSDSDVPFSVISQWLGAGLMTRKHTVVKYRSANYGYGYTVTSHNVMMKVFIDRMVFCSSLRVSSAYSAI